MQTELLLYTWDHPIIKVVRLISQNVVKQLITNELHHKVS